MSRDRIKVRPPKRKQRQGTAAAKSAKAQKGESRAAVAPGGDHRVSAIRGNGVPAKRLPGPGAEGVERIPLPWRERLESRLQRPLSHLEVLTGPAVVSALEHLGATAATRGHRIYLADAEADFGTVAHEVVHALQAAGEPVTGPAERTNEGEPETEAEPAASEPAAASEKTVEQTPTEEAPVEKTPGNEPEVESAVERVVEADAPAEQEAAVVAERLALDGPGSEVPALEQSLEPGDVALLRVADPASDPSARLEQALGDGPVETAASSEAAKSSADAVDSGSADPGPDSGPEASRETSSESAPELEPSPTFDLPEMPATELSAAEAAARQAEQQQALSAIDQADNASGTVGAFADAPPSVKAMAQGSLGAKIDGAVQKEESDFAAGVPEFHAEMGGTPLSDQEGVPEVAAPEIGEVRLEEDTPSPDHQPELAPTEDKGKFLANNAVVSFFDRLFGGGGDDSEGRAEAIGKSLNKVETTDSDIDTSPGEKPKVALEGETDPQRIEDQKGAGREQARGARDEAAQAVVEGPGPEQAQLRQMDEVKTVGELQRPQLEGVSSAQGAEKFQALGMPEEVNAQFDADMHGSMRDSMGEAHSAMQDAESERDSSREAAVAEAESERQAAVEEADGEQRDEVLEARKTIQEERQSTLDAQADGVRDLETQAEKESRANDSKIKKRVADDEQTIGKRFDKAEGEADQKLEKGEEDAEAERKKSEEESSKKSWWDRLKSWVKEQFAKLTAAIGKIFDAVRAAIKSALDAVRNFAKGLIDAVASFIKDAIAAFGEMLKGLVDTLLGDLFPELARKLKEKIDGAVEAAQKAVDKAADKLKKGVDALVDKLQAGLDAILDVFQAAINLGLAVLAAAITGDWGEVARLLLEAALKVVGIDPQEFYAFIGKVMDTIGLIVEAPGTFLLNCVNAVVEGFELFAGNFLIHLKGGIIKWLTGAMGDLQIPEKFDLFGVLDLGRQVMGLTWEWLRGKAVKVVGEENVERIEYVLDYVDTVREEGWGGLFQRIMGELSGLAELILGKVKEFLVTKLIIAAFTWIASLFSPVGAIVKLLFTIWNLFLFLKDQLMRIYGIVKSVIDGIANIAHGVLGPAAAKVEEAMANLLPVAIDLIMKLLGVSGVSQKVKEVIQGIRERVDKAADKLIGKALKLFKPGKDKAKEKTSDPEVGGILEQSEVTIGEPMKIERPDDTPMTLFIAVVGGQADVQIKASPARPVDTFLINARAEAEKKEKGAVRDRWIGLLDKAEGEVDRLDLVSDKLAKALIAKKAGKTGGAIPSIPRWRTEVETRELALRAALADIAKTKMVSSASKEILATLFKEQIDAAHPGARTRLRNAMFALSGSRPEVQRMSWSEAQQVLVASDNLDGFLSLPLKSGNGDFAKDMRDALVDEIVGRYQDGETETVDGRKLQYPPTQAEAKKLLPHVVTAVHEDDWSLRATRAALFYDQPLDLVAEVQLGDSVAKALKTRSSGDDMEPRLAKALAASSNFTQFLESIASGSVYGSGAEEVSKNTWDAVWKHAGNQKELKSRFRAVRSGTHEWIQTQFVGDVISKAAALYADGTPALVAILWVRMQNELRSPTKGIIFDPKDRSRTVKGWENDTVVNNVGKDVAVLQGHPGAVYAPVSDAGYVEKAGKPNSKQQTKFSPGWHDSLTKLYKSASVGMTPEGLVQIWDGVDQFFKDTVWDGTGSPSPTIFNAYYAGDSDSAPKIGLSQLQTNYTTDYYKKAAQGIADARKHRDSAAGLIGT